MRAPLELVISSHLDKVYEVGLLNTYASTSIDLLSRITMRRTVKLYEMSWIAPK